MAHPSGRPDPAVGAAGRDGAARGAGILEALRNNPREFSFSQAIRLLKQAYGAGGSQGGQAFLRDQLRIRPYLSLGFPPNDLVTVEEFPRADPDGPDAGRRFRLTATFLGLYGPSSPLPTYYTEELLAEQSEDKSVSRDFVDIVNHGFFLLFALADGYYRLSRRICEDQDPDLMARLFALAGLGHDALLRDAFKSPGTVLRMMGLLTQFPRSAVGLRGLLADRIGVPVQVLPCQARQAPIPLDQCCCLGREENGLGQASWLGFTTTDAMGKIVIVCGPLDAPAYQGLMPGRPDFEELQTLIRFYCTQPLEFDLIFVLGPGEAQPARLGESCWSQLGCDAWLAPDSRSETRAVLPRSAPDTSNPQPRSSIR